MADENVVEGDAAEVPPVPEPQIPNTSAAGMSLFMSKHSYQNKQMFQHTAS